MTLTHGIYSCIGKSHTVNAKGWDKYVIKFEDELGNKFSAIGSEADFDAWPIGRDLDITKLGHQTTLDGQQ